MDICGDEEGRVEMRKTKGWMRDAMIKYWSTVRERVGRELLGYES